MYPANDTSFGVLRPEHPVAAAARPILLHTTDLELKKIIADAIRESHLERDQREYAERRLSSQQAAEYLGCSISHLQNLHKQGLRYEKGRPNYYRLGDLDAFRQTRVL